MVQNAPATRPRAQPKSGERAYATKADIAQVELRIDGHEAVCAERMRRIDQRLEAGDVAREAMRQEMRSGFSGVHARLWWAAAAIMGLQAAALGWFLMTAGLPGAGK